ncbi:thiamine biosynthesis protein ApbE [Thiomicrospira aerophila AL3]|uniref:FAD:protein FMN transferase n=1 Tax=Thiomicrospira aerophila AL3 TaxID=717772 RepID=W0DQF7_9GAMM|nr:FAD:protein FMN transferase [Thiomicrospira aerophila]AHF00667.1 thiamine biosynthesis protein ApbE [Thiomicrospira aerophila AL3]
MQPSTRLTTSLITRGILGLVLAGLLLLSGCQTTPPPVVQTFYVFGTEVSVHIYDTPSPQAQKAIHAIEQHFLAMHQAWHAWEPHGWVYQINQAIAQDQAIEIPADIQAFIQQTQQLSARTHHLFDPGIGSLIALWGFHQRDWQGPPPDLHLRQAWLDQRPSIADLAFEQGQLTSRNTEVRLDFGGNLKGLAVQQAWSILQDHQIPRALLNLGGDLGSFSLDTRDKNPHTNWTIKLRDPQQPERAIAEVILPANMALFTSGTYQRYFDWQGQRFSHLLNPNTAAPADSFASVSVWHPDPVMADTLATALLIAGPNGWQALVAEFELSHYLLIDQQNQLIVSPALSPWLVKTTP